MAKVRVEFPECPSFLVCDAVWNDPNTNKRSVMGIFNRITAKEFPCVRKHMAVFWTLTDGMGKYKMTLRLLDPGQSCLMEIAGDLSLGDNKLNSHDFHVDLKDIVFPEPGEYVIWVTLERDGETKNIGPKKIMLDKG